MKGAPTALSWLSVWQWSMQPGLVMSDKALDATLDQALENGLGLG